MEKGRRNDIITALSMAAGCALAGKACALPGLYWAAGALAVTGLIPAPAAALSRAARKAAVPAAAAALRLLLTLIFYLVITPTAFFYRLSSGDPLRLRRPAKGESMYLARDMAHTRAGLEKPW